MILIFKILEIDLILNFLKFTKYNFVIYMMYYVFLQKMYIFYFINIFLIDDNKYVRFNKHL